MRPARQKKLNGDPIPWLLESDPRTRYRTLIDPPGEPPASKAAAAARRETLRNSSIQSLVKETGEWFPSSITRHDSAALSHYKPTRLADFGLDRSGKGMNMMASKALTRLDNGLFAIRQTLPVKSRGFVKADPSAAEWHAVPCDSPLVTASLIRIGYHDHRKVQRSVRILADKWIRPPGWFCRFFFVEGNHKKPSVCCPMAGLAALHVFPFVPRCVNLREKLSG